LLLVIPLATYKTFTIMAAQHDFVGGMILLVVICGAGLQLIALTWRILEKDPARRSSGILVATIIALLCLTLPYLGPLLSVNVRIGIIALFSVTAAWLSYTLEPAPRRIPSLGMAIIVPVIFLGWALIRLSIIPATAQEIFFNLPLLFLLVGGLFLTPKHGTMRAFMLTSLAGYLFEYMM
jgi:hypothetical protein